MKHLTQNTCRPFPPDRRLEPEEAVPAPGEIILVAENITHHRRKFGFVTYIPQPEGELPAYYLTQNIEQHLVGGNPESPVRGTVTENVCVTDGAVIEVARQGNVSYYGLPAIDDPNATQTTWAAQWRVTSYDDCPNQEHDEPGTMVASASLSDLHTTARFKEDTFQNAWYYKGYYKKEAPVAELLLPDEENIISYSKTRYSVRIGEEVPLPCKVLVMEEFTPEDDGDETTTEKKEYRSRQVTITDGTESQSYEIDPATEPEKEGTWRVFLLPVDLVPDYNRDGKIDQADRGKVTAEKPWRFWVNSDDDSGTEGGDDIPENSTTPDSGNGVVDGVRDLVDFFPLHFDLKAALEVFPETEFQYFLKHESQSPRPGDAHPNWTPSPTFKVVWYPEAELEANTTGENGVGSFLKNLSRAQGIAGRASNTIPKDGIRIPDDMLTAAKSGKGVGLFEARFATDNPIILEIKKNSGTTLVEVEMPVKISEVESMLRSRFLNENLAGGTQGGVPSEPGNWPDADRNGKHFIFVHGYNVSGEQARGWNSEMFKRMFWSGSDAMFTGVAWHGNESQIGTATPDYWRNVHNAFQTSKSMADFVNALPGSGKCIAAHSLGNIVVSSAIKDHGLSVANYYMVDAAAAIEAYSLASTLGNAEMSHPDWRAYDEKLWCSEWHEIFPETDNRHKMTWRDRFGILVNAYNFHSTGEEVLKNGDGTVPGAEGVATSGGVRAWVKQEMSKGFSILSGGGLLHNGTGGWDFNGHWDVAIYSPYGGGGSRRRTPAEAAAIPLADLEEDPFFDPFVNDKFHDPALGSAEAAKYDEVSKALAESLPSLTFAAGSNPIQIFNTRNFDMMALKNGWPEGREVADGVLPGDWLHSDLRNMAFLYTHRVFEKFVDLGDLNQ